MDSIANTTKVDSNEMLAFVSSNEDETKRAPKREPDAIEFLCMLKEFQSKCEREGDYLQAGKTKEKIEIVIRQEEHRREHVIRTRHMLEKRKLQEAHLKQYLEFNEDWDDYLKEYDEKAKQCMQEMCKKHEEKFQAFQQELKDQILSKPPKWSRELLQWRKRQHILAGAKNYAQAQKTKVISDMLEDEERNSMNTNISDSFAKKEANFRKHQNAEISALEKRIESRRKDFTCKREHDCNRLMKRNKNIQASLDSKQVAECANKFPAMKMKIREQIQKGMKAYK